jgi:hypothetical protein
MPADRLRAQLTTLAFPLDARARAAVERCVYDYVDALKALGWPPERVIVAVKRVAQEAGLSQSTGVLLPWRTGYPTHDQLLVDMVGWSIERYYGKTQSS